MRKIGEPDLHNHIHRFLFGQLYPHLPFPSLHQDISTCPPFDGHVSVFHSAVTMYHAPSDLSGIGRMHRQCIHSVPHWRNGPPRRDHIFLEMDAKLPGMRGLQVAQGMLFFSITFWGVDYPCVLVEWFTVIVDKPGQDTGMWIVEQEVGKDNCQSISVIHLDCIVRGAHLVGVSGSEFLPCQLLHTDSLNTFLTFCVNKFADHHSNEIVF